MEQQPSSPSIHPLQSDPRRCTTDNSANTADPPLGEAKDVQNVDLVTPTTRLREKTTLSINTSPVPDNERLHAIVGQHLALTPTIPGSAESATFPATPTSTTHHSLLAPVSPTQTTTTHNAAPSAFQGTLAASPGLAPRVNPSSLLSVSPLSPAPPSVDPALSAEGDSAAMETPSRFNLLGADVADEVYKWHEKESRRQVGRSQTFHVPAAVAPEISQIRAPGGFRRHFIQQDARTRGAPAPNIQAKSFIHFLGLFNMYEFDHFAGENFHSIPRRSIVVPRDLEKRRKSLAETVKSDRKVFTPGQEVDEDEVVIEEPEEKISFSKAVGMLFKTFIASGILFIPNAFKNGGILFSSLVMTLIAVLCLHSFLLLVKCRELHPGSYGDIGQHFYGRWMRYIVLFAIAISQFGFCCGYCIFFAQQFAIVVDSLGGKHLDKIVWIVIFFVILVPFTLVRNISKLGFSTLVADVCIIVGLIYLYVYDIKELAINNGSPTSLKLFNGSDFGLFIGTAVFSYEGIGMVIPICSSMAEPKLFPRALTIVLTIVCVLLVSFGALGYAAYGDNVQTIILDNLPNQSGGEKAGKNAIQLLYIIAIFLTTPLMLFPCIRIVEHVVFQTIWRHRSNDIPNRKVQWMKENVVRIIVDLAVAAVAYAGYKKLDIFISFVGSFACAPLLFIFPPLFHIKAFPEQAMWRKIADIALILFGFLVFVYTLVITIQNFSKDGD